MIHRIAPTCMLAAIVAGNVHAQAAPRRMMPVTAPPGYTVPGAQWFKLEASSGRKYLTSISRPAGVGPFPVVVVLHGAGGLSNDQLAFAPDLASAGFLVVAGCWQASSPSSPDGGPCAEAPTQAEWVADPAANPVRELIALARTLPDARADRVGLYGMSFGGYAALWSASTGAGVQAVVVDAAGHGPPFTPVMPSALTVIAGLRAPLLLMHGTLDPVIPVAVSRKYERAGRALGKSIDTAYFKGTGHVASLQPGSRAEARRRAIAFLKKALR
ncbi:MAG: dienelactone hydrolase family protein [Betaproteobacteria bacterium]|nr:dienelactone hydrolase family protein [Betaproteobacteria bacterium]